MFTSLLFPIFLIIAAGLYFLLPGKYRVFFLLMISWIFCAMISLRSLIILLLISIFTFLSGRRIHTSANRSVRKRRAVLSVIVCVAILSAYKYLPYLLQTLPFAGRIPDTVFERLIIPVGLSFYLFQAIGYLIDVYQEKYPAEKDFIRFSLYLAYFAKFTSGPIERENSFGSQLDHLGKVRFFDRGRLSLAFTYLLYGYFMKLVIADRLSPVVSLLFEAPESYDSLFLIAGSLFYTIQIYCDFAGYSFISIGCSLLFGIRLTQNFNAPYCSKSITEFWRRWHISLSSWLKDYVYIPLGGNQRGLCRKCINTMIVFILCGMWHGAGLNFLAFGFLHGIYSVLDTLFKKAKLRIPFSRIITFMEVSLAWIFFRASGLRSALSYLFHMVTRGLQVKEYPALLKMLDINAAEAAVIVTGIFLVLITDILSYRNRESFPRLIQHMENMGRYLVFYLMIVLLFIFGIYGPGYQSGQFIYMQF